MSCEMQNGKLSDSTVVAAIEDQVSCDLAGESVILNLRDGVYYGLDPVGTDIWLLAQQSKTITQIRDTLMDKYEVDPEQCEQGLQAFLKDMSSKGLVELRNGNHH